MGSESLLAGRFSHQGHVVTYSNNSNGHDSSNSGKFIAEDDNAGYAMWTHICPSSWNCTSVWTDVLSICVCSHSTRGSTVGSLASALGYKNI